MSLGTNPHVKGWMKQPSRRKKYQSRQNSQSHYDSVKSFTNQASNHDIHAEDLAQTHAGSVIATSSSVSRYEPCLVDSVG